MCKWHVSLYFHVISQKKKQFILVNGFKANAFESRLNFHNWKIYKLKMIKLESKY